MLTRTTQNKGEIAEVERQPNTPDFSQFPKPVIPGLKAENTDPQNPSEENPQVPNSAQDQPISPANPTGKKKSIFSLILRGFIQIILMIGVLTGSYMAMERLIDAKPEIRKRPGFRTVYTIETIAVSLGDNRPNYTVYGQATASRTVDLRSLVSGEVIAISNKLKAGALVRKGDALVEIDAFKFNGELSEARANRDEALARIKENKSRISLEKSNYLRLNEQLGLARKDHQRIAGLRARGTSTQKQLDDRAMIVSQRAQATEMSNINLQAEEARLEQQMASLTRLKWRIELAERNLLNTVLKAPFDGVVRTTAVEIGKTITANDVVVSLYEDAKIDIRFTLTDERYGRLQAERNGLLERPLEIIWAIGGVEHSYPATIDRIGAEISSNRGGVEVYATLQQVKDNPQIRPGAFVEIRVPDVQFVNTAIVPETAIYNGDKIYLKNGGKLISRKVKVLAHNNGNVIISADIINGERVLTTRIAEISDGIRVREEGDALPSDKSKKSKRPGSKNKRGS